MRQLLKTDRRDCGVTVITVLNGEAGGIPVIRWTNEQLRDGHANRRLKL
jgi:hypothetical protein